MSIPFLWFTQNLKRDFTKRDFTRRILGKKIQRLASIKKSKISKNGCQNADIFDVLINHAKETNAQHSTSPGLFVTSHRLYQV